MAMSAWLPESEHSTRCGQPTAAVDPIFGGPLCAEHRRSSTAQTMTCCQCSQPIAPGSYFEFFQSIEQRQKDGSDLLICGPCLRAQLHGALEALRQVPEELRS